MRPLHRGPLIVPTLDEPVEPDAPFIPIVEPVPKKRGRPLGSKKTKEDSRSLQQVEQQVVPAHDDGMWDYFNLDDADLDDILKDSSRK